MSPDFVEEREWEIGEKSKAKVKVEAKVKDKWDGTISKILELKSINDPMANCPSFNSAGFP